MLKTVDLYAATSENALVHALKITVYSYRRYIYRKLLFFSWQASPLFVTA